MDIPETVVFTDGSMLLPAKGIYLRGFTSNGERVTVQVRQYNIPGVEHAGCLLLNNELLPLRSQEEDEVVRLLEQAAFEDEVPDGAVPDEEIVGHVITPDGLRDIRDAMVSWVRSDEYVDVVTNGVKPAAPWQPWNAASAVGSPKPAESTDTDRPAERVQASTREAVQSLKQRRASLNRWRQRLIVVLLICSIPWFALRIFFPDDVMLLGVTSPFYSAVGFAHADGYGLLCGTLPGSFSEWAILTPGLIPFREAVGRIAERAQSGGITLGFVSVHTHVLAGDSGTLIWVHPISMVLAMVIGVGLFVSRGQPAAVRRRRR